jgi:glycosyltransferase involved in cell wall biosynthesis
MFTPVRPQRSGIADYTEELLPFLREQADVCVVVSPEYVRDAIVPPGVNVIPVEDFLRSPESFGLPIYQVGNSVAHHGYMVPAMWRCPGVLVLHDCCLQHLILGLTLMRGDARTLRDLLHPGYGAQASGHVRKLLFGRVDPLSLSFAHALITHSRGVIVHSRYAQQFVRDAFPTKPVAVVAMGVPAEPAIPDVSNLKTKYGFADTDFLLVSATTPAHNKRIEPVLRAMIQLLPRHSQLRLVILGSGPLGSQARTLLSHPTLAGRVQTTGWTSPDAYRDYIRLADAVVDMRYPSGGETSASLLRAAAAGKPLVVSRQGSFSELPDSASIKIAVDAGATRELTEALAQLISDSQRRLSMGRAAREFAATQLRLDQAAVGYVRFAKEIASSGPMIAPEPFSSFRPSILERWTVSGLYGFSRSLQFLQAYGWKETLARIRGQVGGRRRNHSDLPAARAEAVVPR